MMNHFNPCKTCYTLLFLLSIIPFSFSEIKNTRVLDDYRTMILFESFGFGKHGHVSISVTNVSLAARHGNTKFNPSLMGFFVADVPSFRSIWNYSMHDRTFCVLTSRYAKLIFKFDNLKPDSTYTGSIEIGEPNEYNLVFGNCQPDVEVSMHVHTEMYNLKDGEKDFLSAGKTPLPKFYFLLFLVYAAFFIVWVIACKNEWPRVEKIHMIMGALLLSKCLKMICASEDTTYVRNTGTPHGWDVAFYVFGFFKGIMLFTVIILIGTGWSILKPYLQEREKQVLKTVIPLQVLENIVYVVINETGPATRDWMTWNQLFLLIDIACCCVVFFPIIWSIRSLKEASKRDGKAAKNLEKLTLFKQFYIVVIVYLYFTRIVVSAIGAFLNYRFAWLVTVLEEGASLVFYGFIFYNFQPTEKNPYLVVNDEEEENAAAQMMEEDDDDPFEL
ncbi:putative UDP-N-acetylglucosamine--peptide N-acetylglucosaminyltransferase SEC-like [Hibiscus syriacus]|uniref:UDP-N-acetylglucosamine--peptide N-acetylglucosaminyltransferase SEC-like n=1 Tax=Hibiscus syriacus TaxID=106335 RepID=A0A6A3C9H3_HIBSY|nr:protein CANDIDATE G-PROTEIN COUPLED RECEPTOR 7-like [Hibiscus syriacus]KAE8725217.1 putative UDP-N-acetylglucosamine--peptide N-acetylglucosaminyltransferase SEC-like [Hibiscus syriacus]